MITPKLHLRVRLTCASVVKAIKLYIMIKFAKRKDIVLNTIYSNKVFRDAFFAVLLCSCWVMASTITNMWHCIPGPQPTTLSSVFLPALPRESQILFSVDDQLCPDLAVPASLLKKYVGDVICLSLGNLSSLCSVVSSALFRRSLSRLLWSLCSVFTGSSRARTTL